MNKFLVKLLLIIFFIFKITLVRAHEMWLEPINFVPTINETLSAHIKVGQNFNGESYPYIKSETKSLKLFNQQKIIKLKHRDGDYPAIQSPMKQNGLYVLSYESIPEKVNYENFNKFKEFLEEQDIWNKWSKENPSYIISTINVIFTRYAKSLIQTGKSIDQDFNTQLLFEIIALENPYSAKNKEGIKVLLLYKNKPFANSLITVFNKINNITSKQKIITDAKGEAYIPLKKQGTYLLSAVHFIKNNNKDADWHSLWASLTFEKK